MLQPIKDESKGIVTTYDSDLAEEFATMFFIYQSDQRLFGDRILNYEYDDEDGNSDSFPKRMGNAHEVFAHHLA